MKLKFLTDGISAKFEQAPVKCHDSGLDSFVNMIIFQQKFLDQVRH